MADDINDLDILEKMYGRLLSNIGEARLEHVARMNALYDEATALHLRIIEMQIRDKRERLGQMEKQ